MLEPTADIVSKEAVTISTNVSTLSVKESREVSENLDKTSVEDDESLNGQECEMDIVLEDIVDNFEKQVLVEMEKDNLKIDATPMKIGSSGTHRLHFQALFVILSK